MTLDVTLDVTVDELDISKIYVGQSATVTVDALAGERFSATVSQISNSGTNDGGNSKFTVELTLAHPYWHSFREETGAPDFDSYDPSVAEYLNEYEDEVNGLHELAAALLHIMDANGAEQWDDVPGGQTAQADSTAAAAASQTFFP